jgi:hypothetical protein
MSDLEQMWIFPLSFLIQYLDHTKTCPRSLGNHGITQQQADPEHKARFLPGSTAKIGF